MYIYIYIFIHCKIIYIYIHICQFRTCSVHTIVMRRSIFLVRLLVSHLPVFLKRVSVAQKHIHIYTHAMGHAYPLAYLYTRPHTHVCTNKQHRCISSTLRTHKTCACAYLVSACLVCTYVCMCACVHVCMYACMHVRMYVCTYVHACMCLCLRFPCIVSAARYVR